MSESNSTSLGVAASRSVTRLRAKSLQFSHEHRLFPSYLYALLDDGAAVMGGALGILSTFIAAYFQFVAQHGRLSLWVLAALSFLFASYRVWATERRAFLVESERNASPELGGRIISIDINPILTEKFSDTIYDCFLILQLRLHGETAMPTMVSRWQLDLLWQGVEHPGTSEKLEKYRVKHIYAHPGSDGTEYETEWLPLTEFPNDEEITNTNYKVGSVRFSVRSLPVDAVESGKLREDVNLRLQAFDSKENPHLIYEGTTRGLAVPGVIRRARQKMMFNPTSEGPKMEFYDSWEE